MLLTNGIIDDIILVNLYEKYLIRRREHEQSIWKYNYEYVPLLYGLWNAFLFHVHMLLVLQSSVLRQMKMMILCRRCMAVVGSRGFLFFM